MNLKGMGLAIAVGFGGMLPTHTEVFRLESVGARGGTSALWNGPELFLVEGFANLDGPWRWQCGRDCYVQTRLDCTAGWLHGQRDNAFIGSLGPTLEFGGARLPLALEAGLSPAILSRDQFGGTDFGTLLQFDTHAGLLWRIKAGLTLEARFQHISNGGFATPNPGLNLLTLGARWQF